MCDMLCMRDMCVCLVGVQLMYAMFMLCRCHFYGCYVCVYAMQGVACMHGCMNIMQRMYVSMYARYVRCYVRLCLYIMYDYV